MKGETKEEAGPLKKVSWRGAAMVVGLLAAVWSLSVPMAAEAAIKVKLVNRSSQKIWVAMTYKDLEGDWVNRGWWTVRPGSSMTPNIQTKNRIVYFYAHGASGGEWSGEGEGGAIRRWVVNQEFFTVENQQPDGDNLRQVVLMKRDVGSGGFTMNFDE